MNADALVRAVRNNLRDGAVADVKTFTLGDAVDSCWFWVPINIPAAVGGNPTAQELADHFDRLQTSVPSIIEIYYHRFTTDPSSQMTPAAARRAAIIVGTCRAVSGAQWAIRGADLNLNECGDPVDMVLVAAQGNTPAYYEPPAAITNVTRAVAHHAADTALANGEVNIDTSRCALNYVPNGGNAGAGVPQTVDFGVMTPAEVSFCSVIATAATALPALAGVAFLDGRHIYTKSNRNIYTGVFRQVGLLGTRRTAETKEYMENFSGDGNDNVEGLLVHKALHPIRRGVMTSIAKSRRCAENIVESGLGAASVRLPYKPGSVKRYESYAAIAANAGRELKNAVPSMGPARNAAAYVLTYGRFPALANLSAASDPVRAVWPPGLPDNEAGAVVKHKLALKALDLELAAIAEPIAYCKGFVRAMMEDNNIRSGLLTAPSMRALDTEYGMAVAAGGNFYTKLSRYDRDADERGRPRPQPAQAPAPPAIA